MRADLQKIISRLFNVPAEKITADTTARDVDGWDSLSHVQLIDKVEKFYNVRFSFSEVMMLRTVGDLQTLLEKHLNRS